MSANEGNFSSLRFWVYPFTTQFQSLMGDVLIGQHLRSDRVHPLKNVGFTWRSNVIVYTTLRSYEITISHIELIISYGLAGDKVTTFEWKIRGILFMSCLSFRNILNSTLLISFKQRVQEFWYFTRVFLFIGLFSSVPILFTMWPWIWSLDYFMLNLTL